MTVTSKMNIIFFGSSPFSIPILEKIYEKHDVAAVITVPDAKQGRGLKTLSSCVKSWCLDKKVNCLTPDDLNSEKFIQSLRKLSPDVSVTASYGKLIPESVLSISSKENLNVHPSLLPKYRGASPIQRAILDGQESTGLTILRTVKQLDAGEVLLQKSLGISTEETASELSDRLCQLGVELILEALEILKKIPNPEFHPQEERLATYAPKIKKEDGLFQWRDSALSIDRKARALAPWPVAHTQFKDQTLRILKVELSDADDNQTPGTILKIDKNKGFLIQTGEGGLWIEQLQIQGKKVLDGFHFLMGQRLKEGMGLS